jgi:MOSC domain-containing protein YiiM
MVRVEHILCGQIVPFGPNGEPSGIDKKVVEGPVEVGVLGIEGDAQGDRKHHGGVDKALHHYPRDHYGPWSVEYPPLGPRLQAPGAFGENLSTMGWTEADVCVGDVFRVGTARVQVSQGRQPCWKLNVRFGMPTMARLVQSTGRTGWYYRVLEPGVIEAGDGLELLERPHPEWTLSRMLHVLFQDTLNFEALAQIAALEVLPPSWRETAARRLARREVEDWRSRLNVPEE